MIADPFLNSTLQSVEDSLNRLYPNRNIRIVPAVGGYMVFVSNEEKTSMVKTFVDQTILDRDEGVEPFFVATAQLLEKAYLPN